MDVVSVLIPAATALAGAAASWGAMATRVGSAVKRVAELEEDVRRHDRKFETVTDDLTQRKVAHEQLRGKLLVLEKDSDERAFDFDKLYSETREQTATLNDIQRRLGRVTIATPTHGLAESASPGVPRPPAMPPMRPRAKSYRGESG